MSSFFKKKKRPVNYDTDPVSVRTETTGGGDRIESIYGPGEQKQPNKRYKHASVAVALLKYVVITLFFLFFMTMTFVYSSEINIENFRYILKDMNLKIPTGIEEYGDIYYVADMEQSFAFYRDDFVCVGRNSVEVIDTAGRQVQNTRLRYVKPRLVTSGKYMLVYDLSNTQYGIFNTFSQLYSGTLDYPISDADMNDDGYYLIVTRDTEYKSAVHVYNKDMKPVYSYQSNDRYIFDAHIYNDGTVMIYASRTMSGKYFTEILKGNIKSDEMKTVYSADGVMPLTAEKTGSGTSAVLCTDTLLFFKGDEMTTEYDFYGRVCRRFACGDGYAAIILSSEGAGADSDMLIFDRDGTLVYSGPSSSDVSELYVHGGNVYGLYTGCVERFEIRTEKTYRADTGYEVKGIVFPSDEIALFATASSAYPVSVYDDFTEIE
ncbi:MAG: hypothetical protein J6330_05570, partial [Clostridia bacterium]|nr:hypothetical protein [Clostridia bacterium]